jgi:hypothetical protein
MMDLEFGTDPAKKLAESGSCCLPGLLVVVKSRTEPPAQLLEALHALAPQDHSVSEGMERWTK